MHADNRYGLLFICLTSTASDTQTAIRGKPVVWLNVALAANITPPINLAFFQ